MKTAGGVVRAVLFDKDGTLFDFHATWADVTERALSGLARTEDERQQLAEIGGFRLAERRFVPGSPIVSGAISDVARLWASVRPDLGTLAIERFLLENEHEAVIGGALAPAVDPLGPFLNDLANEGYRLGVATHDSEGAARRHLETVDAASDFDFIAGYDSGHGLKPGPGMAFAFAEAIGLSAETIAMVGDSVQDLETGRAAGAALSIGVLSGPAPSEDLAPYADHVIDSIADLPALLRRHNAAI